MTAFERALNILFCRLAIAENDPGMGYRIFRLPNEDQARIFRLPRRKQAKPANAETPPTVGLFVAVCTHPELKQPCLAYCAYPEGGGESIRHAFLAYHPQEISKGAKHIADYLNEGKIPRADGEFVTTPET